MAWLTPENCQLQALKCSADSQLTNVEHGKCLSRATNDKRPFATKLFGGDHETDSGDNNLDNTVDTGREKTSRTSGETHTLEDLRGVVVDARILGQQQFLSI
jgi:hypothetical protein